MAGTAIDVNAARALGFTGLDVVERTFDLPLAWQPQPTTGRPATGYDAKTTIHGQTTLEDLEYVTTDEPQCAEFLRGTLRLDLETADGAVSIGGPLTVTIPRGDSAPSASGELDLTTGVGTLRLNPDPRPKPLEGGLTVVLGLWPSGVRGALAVSLRELAPRPAPADDVSSVVYLYSPLQARFPIDACEPHTWPLAPDELGAAPDGSSALEAIAHFSSGLVPGPLDGAWTGGASTSVTTTLGAVTAVCKEAQGFSFAVPLNVESGDGRVHVAEAARGGAVYDAAGNLSVAFVEAYHSEPVSSSSFAAASGISGVDLGAAPAAFWHTELYFTPVDGARPGGQVVVEGADADGAVLGPITALSWSQ